MKKIVESVRAALKENIYYSALFTALALPDICAALENGQTSGRLYAAWWESNLPNYKGFLGGDDCYALRCAILHLGKDDITDQHKRRALDHYVFLNKGPHCNLIADCEIGGEKMSFLQLDTGQFCEDICSSVEKWLAQKAGDPVIQGRLKEGVQIHESGYVHLGAIRFG